MDQLSPHELAEFAEFMDYKKKSEELVNEFRRYQQSKKLVTDTMQFGSPMDFLKFKTSLECAKPSVPLAPPVLSPSWATKPTFSSAPAAVDPTFAAGLSRPNYTVPEIIPGKIPIKTTGPLSDNDFKTNSYDFGSFGLLGSANGSSVSSSMNGQMFGNPLHHTIFGSSAAFRNGFQNELSTDNRLIKKHVTADDDSNDIIFDRVVPAVKRQKIGPKFLKPSVPNVTSMSVPKVFATPSEPVQQAPKPKFEIDSMIKNLGMQHPMTATSASVDLKLAKPTPPVALSPAPTELTNSTTDDDEAHIVVAMNRSQLADSPSDSNSETESLDKLSVNGAESLRSKNEASKRSREKRRERHEQRRKEKAELERRNIDLTLKLQSLQKTLISLRQQICNSCYQQVQTFLYDANSGKKGINVFTLKKCNELHCKGSRHIGMELDKLSYPVVAR